ncbi:ataxin-2-like protein [Zonotrichia leucophrys gambelii]|uniref:ataxin-2-like protein n=1 Tax=Zonotrichia leucophrys gambelii TaxID=257770 RepID=UPI003140427C
MLKPPPAPPPPPPPRTAPNEAPSPGGGGGGAGEGAGPAGGGGAGGGGGRANPAGKSPVFEGVYGNSRMLHVLTAGVGSTAEVRVRSGRTFEGIFRTLSAQFELALDAVHRRPSPAPGPPPLPRREELVDTMVFKHLDVVVITLRDVTFTKNEKLPGGGAPRLNGEKVLERWEGPDGSDDYELDSDLSNGWDAAEMFRFNEENYGVRSTYDSSLAAYTVPLAREDSAAWRQRLARAAALAREIEALPGHRLRAALEDQDSEGGRGLRQATPPPPAAAPAPGHAHPGSGRESPAGHREKPPPLPPQRGRGLGGSPRCSPRAGGGAGAGPRPGGGAALAPPLPHPQPLPHPEQGPDGGPARTSPKAQRPLRGGGRGQSAAGGVASLPPGPAPQAKAEPLPPPGLGEGRPQSPAHHSSPPAPPPKEAPPPPCPSPTPPEPPETPRKGGGARTREEQRGMGKVKRSRLNPNAKEFSPGRGLAKAPPSAAPSPTPRPSPTLGVLPAGGGAAPGGGGAGGGAGLYPAPPPHYISYIPQLHVGPAPVQPPQLFPFPVSGSASGKFRGAKGSPLPPRREPHPPPGSAPPPLVAAPPPPFSSFLPFPGQAPPPAPPTLVPPLPHYQQPVFAPLLPGGARLLPPPHQGPAHHHHPSPPAPAPPPAAPPFAPPPPPEAPPPGTPLYAAVHPPFPPQLGPSPTAGGAGSSPAPTASPGQVSAGNGGGEREATPPLG